MRQKESWKSERNVRYPLTGKTGLVAFFAGKTAKQLGEPRYIALGFWNDFVSRWKYVRPIDSCFQPKIDGDVYTWEMEVAE